VYTHTHTVLEYDSYRGGPPVLLGI
jgi:hypothetical protein